MSRRTRTKMRRQPHSMGLNHHSQYSSSSTYFPHSYSIFGSPITMPTKIWSLYENNSINYICKQEQLLQQKCPIFTLSDTDINNANEINITISGVIIKRNREYLTKILFFLSMAFCFLLLLFRWSVVRKQLYTQYRIRKQQYEILAKIITQKLTGSNKLIINIQDNQFDQIKSQILMEAVMKFLSGNNEQTQKLIQNNKPLKKVIIRNYCYYMDQKGFQKQLRKPLLNKNGRFVFIWQKYIKDSSKCQEVDQENRILIQSSILDC